MEDYYRILDLSVDASQEEIKEQYRLLIQAWHPDRFGKVSQKAKAEQRTKAINEAYTILGNPDKRAEYDRNLTSKTTRDNEKQRQSEEAEAMRRAEDERRQKMAETERRKAEYEKQQKVKFESEQRQFEHERQQQEYAELKRHQEASRKQRKQKMSWAIALVVLLVIAFSLVRSRSIPYLEIKIDARGERGGEMGEWTIFYRFFNESSRTFNLPFTTVLPVRFSNCKSKDIDVVTANFQISSASQPVVLKMRPYLTYQGTLEATYSETHKTANDYMCWQSSGCNNDYGCQQFDIETPRFFIDRIEIKARQLK